jgi:DtxR family Mn-dependent transcriptional regulator
LYLVRALGYSWDEVHEEAERLEHHISEKLEARIATALGNPVMDPHGDPIPALDGSLPNLDLVLLGEMPINRSGTVSQITDQSAEMLRHMSELGLIPGAVVTLTQRSTISDTVTIHVDTSTYTVSTQVAAKVLVTPKTG